MARKKKTVKIKNARKGIFYLGLPEGKEYKIYPGETIEIKKDDWEYIQQKAPVVLINLVEIG